jgi:hypothetical protein
MRVATSSGVAKSGSFCFSDVSIRFSGKRAT